MRHDGELIVQELNYRELAQLSGHRNPSVAVRAKRARRMDMALQLAARRSIPIRVIVVDGTRRGEDGADASEVERRMLDRVPWHVVTYDDQTGRCRVARGDGPPASGDQAGGDQSSGRHRLARIGYNSAGWQRPTGEAGEQESAETYNAKNRFGHEDWLFRAEWVIDGWRYAFIQGLNKNRRAYIGRPLDISLFTIEPDKRRRLIATIYGLEALDDDQARNALDACRSRGWLKTMQDEVVAIGGNTEALGAPKWAEHVLNVRYRVVNVDAYPTGTYLPDDEWIHDRHRYMLDRFEGSERERVEAGIRGRQGSREAPESRRLFRRGTNPVEYTPEHQKMQAKLLAELQQEYGRDCVWLEKDFVDARVETVEELISFEIKTDLDPRAVIRQSMGQILEYAYHPSRGGRRPDKFVIAGRVPLGAEDQAYLGSLRDRFKLPLAYRVVAL